MSEPQEGWDQVREVGPENLGAALDDIFKMDSGLDSLSRNVDNKRRSVSFQSRELEALEAQLRAAEERLQQAGIGDGPSTRPVARDIQAQLLQRPEPVSEEPEVEEQPRKSAQAAVDAKIKRREVVPEEEDDEDDEDDEDEDDDEDDEGDDDDDDDDSEDDDDSGDEATPATTRLPLRTSSMQPASRSPVPVAALR